MAPKDVFLADTGFIIASLFCKESRHLWTKEIMKDLSSPMLTCEAVLSESLHLAQRLPLGPSKVLELFENEILQLSFNLFEEQKAVFDLIHKYSDLPMSLADASLVRMAEKNPRAVIVTLDHHFEIYRKNRRHSLSILMPPDLP